MTGRTDGGISYADRLRDSFTALQVEEGSRVRAGVLLSCSLAGTIAPMLAMMEDRRWTGPPRVMTLALVLVVACSIGVAATSASASKRLVLAAQPNVPFPVRVYTLSLPGGGTPSRLAVTENGRNVKASLISVGQKSVPFSAVVLLDSSLTMIGNPLVAARVAASALIRGKPARSELALYGFSAKPYLIQDWSKRRSQLTASLGALKTIYGTAVWNAVVLGSRQLKAREGSAKALVILTDGRADTTRTKVGAAIVAANSVGARVFVVIAGPGGAAQRPRLKRLADRTGGSVLKVSSIGELRRAFAGLARTLSRQYLLSYASQLKRPDQRVLVRVRIGDATGVSSYSIPSAPPPPKPGFWFTTKGTATIVLALLVPLLLLAAIGLFRGRRRYDY